MSTRRRRTSAARATEGPFRPAWDERYRTVQPLASCAGFPRFPRGYGRDRRAHDAAVSGESFLRTHAAALHARSLHVPRKADVPRDRLESPRGIDGSLDLVEQSL